MALEHYRIMHIKQVEHDTLSHFVLSRSSTFSLAASGDLTLATECIESSQIYISNTQDVGVFISIPWFCGPCSQVSRLANTLPAHSRGKSTLRYDFSIHPVLRSHALP